MPTPTGPRPHRSARFLALAGSVAAAATGSAAAAVPPVPRIVNLYNFARNSDDRVPDSERVLFETTQQQVRLIRRANLPATWALQYDALVNPKYQQLFKTELGPADEIAAWWELPRRWSRPRPTGRPTGSRRTGRPGPACRPGPGAR